MLASCASVGREFFFSTTVANNSQTTGRTDAPAWVVLPAMVARRARPPDSSAEEESTDVDSASVDDVARPPARAHSVRKKFLPSLKVGQRRASPDELRLWPLCFAIAIERSQRLRPMIAVASASALAGLRFHLQNTDAEMVSSAIVSSPLVVFASVETTTLVTAFFVLLPYTRRRAKRDDKNSTTELAVADSAVLSSLPPSVARFVVGSGVAWRRMALAVARDLSLFLVTYLLCVAFFLGADDVDAFASGDGLARDGDAGDARDAGDGDETWQEMGGGISVHSYAAAEEED